MDLTKGFDVDAAKIFFKTNDNMGQELTAETALCFVKNATVQRGYVYSKDVSDNAKKAMWDGYREFVYGKLSAYEVGVSEKTHVYNIEQLVKFMTAGYSDALESKRFRFGSAQKIFNLTLKYYWVMDEIEEPPHAPIDSYIAEAVGWGGSSKNGGYKWTKSTSGGEYLKVIESCKKVSKFYGLSIAQWELFYWNFVLFSSSIGNPKRD
ncbi:hypothetical protein D0S45_09350 [Marinifilum sp. JC120]|nr:hypothetical protein D0S45_09350 [Marinifilum sp. JC120]